MENFQLLMHLEASSLISKVYGEISSMQSILMFQKLIHTKLLVIRFPYKHCNARFVCPNSKGANIRERACIVYYIIGLKTLILSLSFNSFLYLYFAHQMAHHMLIFVLSAQIPV